MWKVFVGILFLAITVASCGPSNATRNDQPGQTPPVAADNSRYDQPGETRPVAADNSAINVRDRDDAMKTADDQSGTEADRTITQHIRQSIVDDDSMSISGRNVKIVTVDGLVTLRGPVTSEIEKTSIGTKAQKIAGVKRVDNQLEIAK